MNSDFTRLLAFPVADRRGLFVATAARLGTTVQNIEKDFWVCWVLDALFNGLATDGPRLLFKGGTSLSKGHGLIERFSEDVDITVFRADIDTPASVEDLEALSRKKRDKRLEEIKLACQAFIGGSLKEQLGQLAGSLPMEGALQVVLDEDDADRQTLLLHFPAVMEIESYVRPAVKIEAGAKSALDPHEILSIRPYISGEAQAFDLAVRNVVTVDPVRTFWDKVLILHSLRFSFEEKGTLRGGGQRVSRHYYDVDHILRTDIGRQGAADLTMARDCARHERMFFQRPGQATASPGTFALVPPPAMLALLRADYAAMSIMIFGDVPKFDDIIASISALEKAVNL